MLIELDKNTSNIWGGGSAGYPCLGWQVPVFIWFHEKGTGRYALRGGEAQLRSNHNKIADAQPISINRLIQHGTPKVTEYLNLEFPLDRQQIAALENARQSGSVKLELWISLHIDEHRPVQVLGNEVWQLAHLSVARLQQEIEISQSNWVNNVLPGTGHGKIHVVEFPAAALDSCQALVHSFEALKQAGEKHRLGFYDDAVGRCRMALERFFDSVPVDPTHADSRRIPVLKKSWEKKMGKATYDWLNSTLGAIKDASNPTHHSPNAHYDQLESQMILAITTAVIAYVARASETDEPTS
jgi:hypothetical protein